MEHLTKVQLQNRMNNNFVNIDNPDLYIYRVFKVNRLIEMFKTKKLVVVKPELWDDPFENFLIKSSTPFTFRRDYELSWCSRLLLWSVLDS
jgi:hypothetical protein